MTAFGDGAEPALREQNDPEFWETHCWAKRFSSPDPCAQAATWMGPQGPEQREFTRRWRACDEHRIEGDVLIQTVLASSQSAQETKP